MSDEYLAQNGVLNMEKAITDDDEDVSGKDAQWSINYSKPLPAQQGDKPYGQVSGYGIHGPDTIPATDALRPSYYGGKDNVYEARKVIRAHNMGFNLGNAFKYMVRQGKKDKAATKQDLEKAIQYIRFAIEEME
jgi:hypothetical protein